MMSRLTTLLLTLGLLSLVTARPVSHKDAKKQETDINDLFTNKDLADLFKSIFPSNGAKEQGFSTSITLPGGRTFEWGKKQGQRVPFSKGETQAVGTAQNAAEQGLSITLPDGNTFELGEEQGRRIVLPKEQSYAGNNLEDFLNGFFQPSKTAKEQGFSITLPDGNTFELGREQGRRVGWSHEQGRRVGWGEEQGRRVGWAHEQGRRVPFGEEQGRRVGWGEQQSWRVPFGEKQGRIIPYYGSDIKEQSVRTIPSVKEQSTLNPWLSYRYPYSKQQAKQQSFFPYYDPGYNNQYYAKQQGRRILIPTAKQQDIQIPFPLYYYNTPLSSKDKNVQAAIESIYNTAAIEALCSAASDKEKIAEVAAYVQQNFDDLLKQFQGFTNFCDLMNGANGNTGKDAKGLSKDLNELLEDEK